jgi:hypothetical protein
MSLTIALVFVLLVLVGCEGYNRLVDSPKREEPVVVQQKKVVSGFLHKQNFIELEAPDGIDYVEFQSEHGTKYVEVLPYDKDVEKAKKPFYIISGKSMILFNVVNGSYRIHYK